MTPEEEAYEEALRRIREAEEAGAVELSLGGLEINRLPQELEHLTSLQSLDLSGCEKLKGDLSYPRLQVSLPSNRSTSRGACSLPAIYPRSRVSVRSKRSISRGALISAATFPRWHTSPRSNR
jgi:hypothetical protein